MKYSIEKLYHFTCDKCGMWWSVAATNMVLYNKTWICTWCGKQHKPPHKTEEDIANENR
jgi:transcription elongation factor Elf1